MYLRCCLYCLEVQNADWSVTAENMKLQWLICLPLLSHTSISNSLFFTVTPFVLFFLWNQRRFMWVYYTLTFLQLVRCVGFFKEEQWQKIKYWLVSMFEKYHSIYEESCFFLFLAITLIFGGNTVACEAKFSQYIKVVWPKYLLIQIILAPSVFELAPLYMLKVTKWYWIIKQ